MSRIHDALGRGRPPAAVPNAGRTAHADAVLAALGYKSDKPRVTRAALKLLAVVLGVLAFVAWVLLPPWRELFPAPDRTGTVAHNNPPGVSVPAKTPESNRPAVSVPTSVPKSNPPAAPRSQDRGKLQDDPRASIVAPRTPASASLPTAPALPATRTPPPVVAATPAAAGAPAAGPKSNPPAASAPAAGPKSNPPAVSAPAAGPKSNPPAVSAPAAGPKPNPARPNPPPLSRPGETRVPATSRVGDATPGKTLREPRSSILEPRVPSAAAPARDEFQLALYYQRSGDFEQALMHYRAALQRDEMNVEAHNNLGHLYLGKGLFDEAAREFQRVLAIDQKYVTAHVNLSAAYFSLRRFDAAAVEARAALQIDPRNPDALINLSLAQNAAGQPGDAQGTLRRALEIDPHNAAAHYNMARQFEAAGEAGAAIDHYRQFIQYAAADQTAYTAEVRTRLAALTARIR